MKLIPLTKTITFLACPFVAALTLTITTPVQADIDDDDPAEEVEPDDDDEGLGGPPNGKGWLKDAFELPEDITVLKAAYSDTREALRAELSSILGALPEDASEEDVAAAVDAFRVDNAENIAAQKELSDQLKDALRGLKVDPADGKGKPTVDKGNKGNKGAAHGLSDAAKDIKDQIKTERVRLKDVRKSLKGATAEERAQFVEDQKALKDLRKNFIDEIRKEREDGDTRSGDDTE